ncbi:LysR family transcriptional regulator [bacterium]|nr:LysR family transcriptional regulator [bacterium]
MLTTHRSDNLLRKGLKLSHLRLLAALADTEQLTQAAAAVGVTQPAASRLVAEIERIVGAPVHERTGRGIGLTALGRALALRAQRIRLELDDAARDLAEIAMGGVGHVRIGSVTGPALDRVLPALQRERSLHPNVSVEVVVLASDALCEQLLAGRLDFAVARLPEGPRTEPLTFVPMEREPIALIARRGHPLLRGPAPLTLQDVLTYDWVMPSPESLLTRTLMARLHDLGLPSPTQRLLTASFLLTLAVLQRSDAVAAVSAATAAQFASGEAAAFDLLPVDIGVEVEAFGLITRERVSLTPASQRFADLILGQPAPR